MENRLRFATIGPDGRPRLLARSRRWRKGGTAGLGPLRRRLGWAERIAGRSAFGSIAAGWGRSAGLALAIPRATIPGEGRRARPAAGLPGRPGRDGRLDLALRMSLRVETAGRAAGPEERRGAGLAAVGAPPPVGRLIERLRIVEAAGARHRPAVVIATGGGRTPSPAAATAAVAMARVPEPVPRVLALGKPPPAATPGGALAPATPTPTPNPAPAPDPSRPDRRPEAPTPAPAASTSIWPAEPSLAALPTAVVEQLTDRVVRAIDRRVIAARERFGMGPG